MLQTMLRRKEIYKKISENCIIDNGTIRTEFVQNSFQKIITSSCFIFYNGAVY